MVLDSIGAISYTNKYQPNNTVSGDNKTNEDLKIPVCMPDGKQVLMTLEQFKQYIKYLQTHPVEYHTNPQKQVKAEPYELGPQRQGVRVVDEENVSDPVVPGTTAPIRDVAPSVIEEYATNIAEANGQIDDFRQGKRGDCYLLAAIQSLRDTNDGQDILDQNIQKNSDGSITVTLPGAIAVKNHYKEMGLEDKCYITGKYTITQKAIEKAQKMSGRSYAYGDFEVILYELAMEALKAEILQTNKELGIRSERYIAGQIGPISESDTLKSGFTYDAIFLLTGQKSDLYEAPDWKRENPKYYVPGEYGYVNEEPKLGQLKGLSKSVPGINEVENIYDKESDLQRMLDMYKGREGEFSITVSVIVGQNGPDGNTMAKGGHALSVYKITDDYVEVINPWDTKKHERIPRGDFEKMAIRFCVAPISKEKYQEFRQENEIAQNKSNNIFDWIKNLFNIA